MTKATHKKFYERRANRNENIRREFWREAGAYLNRTYRRKLVLRLSHRWGLHPSGINRIVVRKPTWRTTREDLLKELLPGLNALFGVEYEKYKTEHNLSTEDMYLSLMEDTDDV
jgi:hypothetical protein|tara:strand:+ start:4410 stop:4751 length:342 start_codon:yes stop_codon:yes gene_type:complete